MKKFYLVKMFPVQPKDGFIFNCSGNKVIAATRAENEEKAIEIFNDRFSGQSIVLNCNGYMKLADVSYCVAEACENK